ncbi:uncharacterized protein LOC6047228 [Culex quinquefasciatus]|uniref:uncharacterized protein LOC6047228 n=1 Tax=Culex quinquefasciatus TaxID=7176 RepID=UPI0018E2B5E9|nr:uncharacterized protein LOC6047228 [Culex quinquefasciatus]
MLILTLLALVGFVGVRGYLPPSLSVCHRDDPDLDRCVIAVVNKLRTNIASGDFGDGVMVPSLDPAYIDRLDVDDGANLHAVFKNLTVTGGKNFNVDKLSVNVPDKTMNMLITLHKLKLKGKYNMKMKISLLQIDGDGDATLDITDTKFLLKMHYLLNKQKDTGRTTMKFAPIDLKVKFAGDSKFHLTNLLRNQPRLNKAANEAINESPELILEKAKPAVQQFFSKAFTEIANGVMKEAEEEEAFPL